MGKGAIFSFLFGVGVGAIGMYTWLNDKKNAEKEEEIASIKEEFRKHYGKKKEEEEETGPAEVPKSSLDKRVAEEVKEPIFNYSRRVDRENRADRAEKEFPKEEEDHEKDDSPYEIDESSFMMDKGYSKTDLCWYSGNDILTQEEYDASEDSELIDDECVLLGDVLETSGFKNDRYPSNIIYIRNPGLAADYRVEKIRGEYEYDDYVFN